MLMCFHNTKLLHMLIAEDNSSILTIFLNKVCTVQWRTWQWPLLKTSRYHTTITHGFCGYSWALSGSASDAQRFLIEPLETAGTVLFTGWMPLLMLIQQSNTTVETQNHYLKWRKVKPQQSSYKILQWQLTPVCNAKGLLQELHQCQQQHIALWRHVRFL